MKGKVFTVRTTICPQLVTGIARALLNFSLSSNEAYKLHDNFTHFLSLIKHNPSLELVIKNPLISKQDKASALEEIAQKAGYEKDFLMFLLLLNESDFLSFIRMIGSTYHRQFQAYEGIAVLLVTTPIPLDEQIKKNLKDTVFHMTGKKILMMEKVDKESLGGLTLRWDNMKLDFSLSTFLQQIEGVMKGAIQ